MNCPYQKNRKCTLYMTEIIEYVCEHCANKPIEDWKVRTADGTGGANR